MTQRKNLEIVEFVGAAGKAGPKRVKKYFRLEFINMEQDDVNEDLDFRALENGFVRVSDFNGVRLSISSTLSENNSPRANQTDATDILSFRGKVDDDPQQTGNSEGDGVLYCNLEKRNGLSIESNEMGEKILIEGGTIKKKDKPCSL